jgi:hypothetical protein
VKDALLSSSLFTMIPMKLMKDKIEKGSGFVTTFPVTIFLVLLVSSLLL